MIIILTQFVIFTSCGVKSDPRPPKNTLLPSAEASYMKLSKDKIQIKQKTKSKPNEVVN